MLSSALAATFAQSAQHGGDRNQTHALDGGAVSEFPCNTAHPPVALLAALSRQKLREILLAVIMPGWIVAIPGELGSIGPAARPGLARSLSKLPRASVPCR